MKRPLNRVQALEADNGEMCGSDFAVQVWDIGWGWASLGELGEIRSIQRLVLMGCREDKRVLMEGQRCRSV